jgi:GH15 family glucan-1,4-alpha-glucosidase
MMCWAACDRLANAASHLGLPARAAHWTERAAAIRATIEKELRHGDFLWRYSKPDDFGAPETAFNVCTFWLIEALHLTHRDAEARALFGRMLTKAAASGLLSEDMDFETGELWGNFPQTYSLVGVINCAVLLSKSWNTIR